MSDPYIFDTDDHDPARDTFSPEDRAFLAGLTRSFLAGLAVALGEATPQKVLDTFDSSAKEYFGGGGGDEE